MGNLLFAHKAVPVRDFFSKTTYMTHVNPVEDRQKTNWHRKQVGFRKICAVPGMHRPVAFNGLTLYGPRG